MLSAPRGREDIPEKLDLKELMALFDGRREDYSLLEEREDLGVDMRVLGAMMREIMVECRNRLEECGEDDSNGCTIMTEKGRPVRYVPIFVKVLDPDIPLTFVVQKVFDMGRTALSFDLVRVPVDVTSAAAIQNSCMNASWGDDVGQLRGLLDQGSVDLTHRFVYSTYREQGVGKALLGATEAFMSNREGEQVLEMEAAQLDVIVWLWNSGFRPKEDLDWIKFMRVLDGDLGLELIERYYLFPTVVKGHMRYAGGSDGGLKQLQVMRAFRIRFCKLVGPVN